jgi:hypothetical protein
MQWNIIEIKLENGIRDERASSSAFLVSFNELLENFLEG